jgi:hypothetical protein
MIAALEVLEAKGDRRDFGLPEARKLAVQAAAEATEPEAVLPAKGFVAERKEGSQIASPGSQAARAAENGVSKRTQAEILASIERRLLAREAQLGMGGWISVPIGNAFQSAVLPLGHDLLDIVVGESRHLLELVRLLAGEAEVSMGGNGVADDDTVGDVRPAMIARRHLTLGLGCDQLLPDPALGEHAAWRTKRRAAGAALKLHAQIS